MPLSEQEQRLLEEMERSLYHNDADFVATVAPRRGKPNYTVLVVGILVGVLGFAVMFAGVLIAVTPPRSHGSIPKPPADPRANGTGGQKSSGSGSSSSFMQNMNDRWEKRQDNRDQ